MGYKKQQAQSNLRTIHILASPSQTYDIHHMFGNDSKYLSIWYSSAEKDVLVGPIGHEVYFLEAHPQYLRCSDEQWRLCEPNVLWICGVDANTLNTQSIRGQPISSDPKWCCLMLFPYVSHIHGILQWFSQEQNQFGFMWHCLTPESGAKWSPQIGCFGRNDQLGFPTVSVGMVNLFAWQRNGHSIP